MRPSAGSLGRLQRSRLPADGRAGKDIRIALDDFFRFTRYGVEYLLVEAGFRVLQIEAVGGFGWLMSRRSINALTFCQGGWKWPVFVLLAPLLGFLFPFVLYFIDVLDRQRDFTLGYVCIGQRQETVGAVYDRTFFRCS